MTISVNLGKQVEDYVDELVSAGRYDSRDDVVRQGLWLVEQHEKRLAKLDAALARGLADVEAGRFKPIEEVAARLKAKYAAMAKDHNQ